MTRGWSQRPGRRFKRQPRKFLSSRLNASRVQRRWPMPLGCCSVYSGIQGIVPVLAYPCLRRGSCAYPGRTSRVRGRGRSATGRHEVGPVPGSLLTCRAMLASTNSPSPNSTSMAKDSRGNGSWVKGSRGKLLVATLEYRRANPVHDDWVWPDGSERHLVSRESVDGFYCIAAKRALFTRCKLRCAMIRPNQTEGSS